MMDNRKQIKIKIKIKIKRISRNKKSKMMKDKMYNKNKRQLNNTIQILLILKWSNQLRLQHRITLVLQLVVNQLKQLSSKLQAVKYYLLSKKTIPRSSLLLEVQIKYLGNQTAVLHKLLVILNNKKTSRATNQIQTAQLNCLTLYINLLPRVKS